VHGCRPVRGHHGVSLQERDAARARGVRTVPLRQPDRWPAPLVLAWCGSAPGLGLLVVVSLVVVSLRRRRHALR